MQKHSFFAIPQSLCPSLRLSLPLSLLEWQLGEKKAEFFIGFQQQRKLAKGQLQSGAAAGQLVMFKFAF